MGVTLVISFDKDGEVFYPGQVVQGKVILVNETKVKVKGLTITFFGDAEVYWTEAEARRHTVSPHRNQHGITPSTSRHPNPSRHVHKEYRNQETILCHEIVLFGQSDPEGGTEFLMPAGTMEYPFHYQLPASGLPSTFTDLPYGSIRYSVEARLKRPLFRYDKIEKEFSVKAILDINGIPRVLQPVGIEKRVDFGWICCPQGYMALDLRLSKIGYSPEETLQFSVSIRNFSRNLITEIFTTFTQEVQFCTFDRTKKVSTDLRHVLSQTVVEPFSVATWNANLIIPNDVPPSTLAGCNIISFNYSIKVTGKSLDTICQVSSPIFVGTKPFRDIQETFIHPTSSELASSRNNDELLSSGRLNGNQQCTERSLTNREYNPSLNPFLDSESENEDVVLNSNAIYEKEINTTTVLIDQYLYQ